MAIDLSNRVAIVTGAGGGLGREHALALAKRGAKILVNDLGGTVEGGRIGGGTEKGGADKGATDKGGTDKVDAISGGVGGPNLASGQMALSSAQIVANEIIAMGGQAIANSASVTDFEAVQAMVKQAMDTWGRIDILVNNAGILRDKSFTKMDMSDFRLVMDVHVMGAVHCSKAVWDIMRAQNYGRIVMTTSSSGLYGNFGQSNYGAAKMALVGLMQTLSIEGAKNNVRVNCLAPTAATRMTEGLMPEAILQALKPAAVSPAVVYLCSDDAPSRTILCAGAGSFETANITLTNGCFIGDEPDAADQIVAHWAQISDRDNESVPASGAAQGMIEIGNRQRSIG